MAGIWKGGVSILGVCKRFRVGCRILPWVSRVEVVDVFDSASAGRELLESESTLRVHPCGGA